MAEAFATGGSSKIGAVVPGPVLQGVFIPGIDVPDAQDGFGLVIPLGGGTTARRYSGYGISSEVSTQNTQLTDISNLMASGGGLSYSFEGLVGPQGVPGPAGPPGVPGIGTGLSIAPGMFGLDTTLEQIQDLGTAIDQMIYTSAINYTHTWFEKQPDGDVNKNWGGAASNDDGSALVICATNGKIFTSADYGANWTERDPTGIGGGSWNQVASDSDGSNLIVAQVSKRLYISSDSGASWTDAQPTGDENKGWYAVASDDDGSFLMAAEASGRLYTSSDSGSTWTERQPAGDITKQWRSLACNYDGSFIIAANHIGRVYVSDDGGATWTDKHAGGDSNRYWISVACDETGAKIIAANSPGRLYFSTDYGDTWTHAGLQPDGDVDRNWGIIKSSRTGASIIAAVSPGLVYTTNDSAATWTAEPTDIDPTQQWKGLGTSNDGSRLLAVATLGRVYVTTSVGVEVWSETTITAFARTLVDDANAAAMRTTLGVGTGDSPTFAGLTLTNACVLGSDSAVFQPNANSTTFFQVKNTSGGYLLNIDTTNNRVGIGTNTPLKLLHVTGEIRLDSVLSIMDTVANPFSNILFYDGASGSAGFQAQHNFDQFLLGVDSEVGRQLILCNYATGWNKDFDHAEQTNPTLYIHSATDPDSANDEWISIAHDQTNAVFGIGSGLFNFGGKIAAGAFGSPIDVTNTRQYGMELHYSGNNYDVTGIRSRAQLITTDTAYTAQGALLQAANNDGINAGVLQGALIEAIGKSDGNAATITTMRGCLVNTEWNDYDTVTNLKTLHVRTHSRNAAGAGSFGTGYGIYIENEAVGGNGQAYDTGIYFKGTNLSAGNKAFNYGIDFSGATFASEEIKLVSGSVIGSDSVIFKPVTGSATYFQVRHSNDYPLFTVDTVNFTVNIGTLIPLNTQDINVKSANWGNIDFYDGAQVAVRLRADYVKDQFILATGGLTGRQWIFCDYGNYAQDFDHADNGDPTIYFHSRTAPDSDNTQWMSFTHNTVDGVFGLGKGGYTFPDGNVGIGTTSPTAGLQMGDDKLIAFDTNAGLTASTTQSQGQGALTAQINEISTVANDGDTVTLPSAVTGVEIEIINNGVNTLQIFPASGDDLGLGVNTAEELEANERVKFVAYDITNWAKESTTEIIHAEIHDEDNTDAFVVNDAGGDFHCYHTNGLAAGDLANWAFDAGGAGTSFPIASIADSPGSSGTQAEITTTGAHGLAVGDIVSLTNMSAGTNAGLHVVINPNGTTFEITSSDSTDATGTMDQAATLEADAVAAGVYSFAYYISATIVGNNETFDFQLYNGATAVIGSKIRRKFGAATDFGSMAGGGVVTVGNGDKISFALSNEDSAANIIIRNLTIVLIRL